MQDMGMGQELHFKGYQGIDRPWCYGYENGQGVKSIIFRLFIHPVNNFARLADQIILSDNTGHGDKAPTLQGLRCMSFTYVKATMLSPNYLDDLYARNPGLEQQSYAFQHAAIMRDAHVWADHISKHLQSLGVDAHELVYNAKHLNQAWAREQGSVSQGHELFIEQLSSFKPDVVFLHTYYPLYAELVPLVREQMPEVKLIQGYIGVGFGPEHYDMFRSLDFVTTNEAANYEKLSSIGARAYHIYHGFEHTLLPRLETSEPEYDVLFTGSMVMSNGYHLKRSELLEYLVNSGIELTILSNPVEARAQVPEVLKKRICPAVYGINMLRALARAKVALNIHIDALPTASNIRLFEATGARTCLLTDQVPGLGGLFEPGREVAVYDSFEECAQKIHWLLEHDHERRQIAQAGQGRTLADHRMEQRVHQLYAILKSELDQVSGGRA